MNKSEFVSAIAENTAATNKAITKKTIAEVLDATISTTIELLVNGEDVNLIGFGKFGTKVKPARKGFNPKTGMAIELEEKTIPYFKPSKCLKESVV